MKCVILCAGLGKRLYPLTKALPKPMMPIVNVPLLEHNIAAVKKTGIREILINLFYLPEQIMHYFGDGSQFGVHITWHTEQALSGPAGALLPFEALLQKEEAALVISGDTFHDIDLNAFIDAHKKARVQLSVVMKEIKNPGRYGVGELNSQGFVTRFAEKPSLPSDAYGLISCGIYCINPQLLYCFPKYGVYDFGADLIPTMVDQRQSVQGFKTSAYWADIGTSQMLLEANLDACLGKVKINLLGKVFTGNEVQIEPGTFLEENVQYTGPILVGSGAKIGSGTCLIGPVVIGAGCQIGKEAYLYNTVLLPGSVIADHTVLIGGLISHAQ